MKEKGIIKVVLPEMASLWQETLSWQPNATQQQLFQKLYELILSGNLQMNLTRITAPVEFWEKHLWDSLRGIAPFLKEVSSLQGIEERINRNALSLRVIDIGTGAGFPGLPVAIALPYCTVTLLDSTRKKIAFLNSLVMQLQLENALALTGRAEEMGRHPLHRENYDLAMLRAVAPASVCAEYALPFLKEGGLAIIYRGQWTDKETKALSPAVEKLGGAIASIERFTTPISNSVRHCLYLRKVGKTPAAFPRPTGVPTQKPL